MDIRNAKRPAKGTTKSATMTNETASTPLTPTVNEDGTLNAPPDDITSDIVMLENWNYLREHDITEADLKSILDSILTTGNVRWDFKLLDRVPIAYKIREAWVDDLIIDKIDAITADKGKVSALRYNNLVAEMNLAASLVKFGEKQLMAKTEDDFNNNLDFVRSLTFIFRNRMIEKLAVFDRAVSMATSDWAIKNFTTPPKAN